MNLHKNGTPSLNSKEYLLSSVKDMAKAAKFNLSLLLTSSHALSACLHKLAYLIAVFLLNKLSTYISCNFAVLTFFKYTY